MPRIRLDDGETLRRLSVGEAAYGGDTLLEHLQRVAVVLDRIGGAGYTIRPDKCHFAARSVEFLGCRIGDGMDAQQDASQGLIALVEQESGAEALERHCRFSGVVIHDGTKVLVMHTTSKATMGALSDSMAVVVGSASPEVLWGVYAAQAAASLPELLPGLKECFKNRRTTAQIAAVFDDIDLVDIQTIQGTTDIHTAVRAIVTGSPRLDALGLSRVQVPTSIKSIDIQRDNPAYAAAVETAYPTRAFYDTARSINTFYPIPPKDVRESTGTSKKGRSRGPVKEDVLDAVRRDLFFNTLRTLVDDEEGVDEVGSGAVQIDDEMDETSGRRASYWPGQRHPSTDEPAAFTQRLRPAGYPRFLLARIREQQQHDAYCQGVVSALRREHARAQGGYVFAALAVREGVVALNLTAISDGNQVRSEYSKMKPASVDFALSKDGMLFYRGEERGGREQLWFVVPEVLRPSVMEAAHDSMLHLGRSRTLDALRASGLWWPRQTADVKEFVRRCPTCAFNKVGPKIGATHTPPNGNKPWQVASVDVVYLEETSSGNAEAVVFTDRLSRAVRAYAVPRTLDSKMFLNIVAFALIPDVGVPLMMISDRGSNLISKLCMAFYEEYSGTDPRLADAEMHTAVGTNERFNHTLREMARAAYFDHGCEWDLFLPLLVLYYNATKQESTGYSPYFVEHGREPVLPWHPRDKEELVDSDMDEYIKWFILGQHLVWEVVSKNLGEVEMRRREEHNSKYQTNIKFQPGDRVLLLQPGRAHKMDLPYIGPYRVVAGPDERDRYTLRDLHGRRFNEFHVSKLKLWPVEGDVLEDDYYVVEQVLDWRRRGDVLEFLVKWRGYSQKHNTWEPIENLNDAAQEEAKALLNAKNTDELTTNSTTTAEILDENHSGSIRADGDNKDKTGKSRDKRVSFDSSVPEQAPVRQPRSAEERDARAARRAERRLARELEKLMTQI
ncbi:hypothetical protein AB1Y20_012521 [Prymnesium parvum]|uniref:Chromo domain-containing protein n=1 Tax=Prymnesium parvum TaxID=97485 RepID=A0AB34IKJ0_PRYPA